MVLQLGTRHVFISIAKRPNDIEEYAELIADAQQAFRPLGFSPWIEATNGPDTK